MLSSYKIEATVINADRIDEANGRFSQHVQTHIQTIKYNLLISAN
jgi:hypothetical protein